MIQTIRAALAAQKKEKDLREKKNQGTRFFKNTRRFSRGLNNRSKRHQPDTAVAE